jgi:hypothetical protein
VSAHTPGPWAQHSQYPLIIKQDCAPIAGPDEGVMICNAQSHNNSGFFPSFDEGRANARLIAAAPDLLAVCQRLAESASYWSEYDVPLGIVADLQAAIAKATGAAL